MGHRGLIIADDLTGGLDAGVQFSQKGLSTLFLPLRPNTALDSPSYSDRNILVVSTGSRGLPPKQAYRRIASLLKNNIRDYFPVLYKKIDSTLRGNIGSETEAILKKTGIAPAFLAPSFPEQGRIVAGGIHLLHGTPLSLTEISRDAVSPVKESRIKTLLLAQSRCRIGIIDIVQVASGGEALETAIEAARGEGAEILIFDAVQRRDLTHIAQAAFQGTEIPLLVGSAGLAEEVAGILTPKTGPIRSSIQPSRPLKHILIVSGSASRVSHDQLRRVEVDRGIPSFTPDPMFLDSDITRLEAYEERLSNHIRKTLRGGHAILKPPLERILEKDGEDPPAHLRLVQMISRMTALIFQSFQPDGSDLGLVLFGGDTALSVLERLGMDGIEIQGEISKGVVMGHLVGGTWHGLRLVTKAGAFGREDALEKIIETLENKPVKGFHGGDRDFLNEK